jgi:hypothetical protein
MVLLCSFLPEYKIKDNKLKFNYESFYGNYMRIVRNEKNAKSRLNVEKSVDREKAIVETVSCPFYENGNCKVSGLLELYTRVFLSQTKKFMKKKMVN